MDFSRGCTHVKGCTYGLHPAGGGTQVCADARRELQPKQCFGSSCDWQWRRSIDRIATHGVPQSCKAMHPCVHVTNVVD